MTRRQDQLLFDQISRFTLDHNDIAVAGFKDSMRNWGDQYRPVSAQYHSAADLLGASQDRSDPGSADLILAFESQKHRLRWEQSYRRQDNLVPETMLAGYAFAEIIGKQGPFISNKIRAGIAIWGPGIDYPRHQHGAEEIYILLAGSADFVIADAPLCRHQAGAVVKIDSNIQHGFTTTDETLVVFYLWQAGDLRQTSRFADSPGN